jgi:hypothetical protein
LPDLQYRAEARLQQMASFACDYTNVSVDTNVLAHSGFVNHLIPDEA